MKLRTVGLLGLVLAHIGASALSDKCLKIYRHASDNLTQELERSSNEQAAFAGVGYAVAGAGVGSCAYRAKTVAGKLVCSLLFVALGFVAHETQDDFVREREKMVEAATIYEIYRDFKAPGARTDLEKNALAQIGASSAKDTEVERAYIQLMESLEFCDSRGKPNRTLDEVVRAVQFKLD